MNTTTKLSALLLGAILAAGLAGCKKNAEDVAPAPVTTPNTSSPTPAVTPPPSDTTTPPPDMTTPPATGTTPGTSGTSGTSGTTGAGQPSANPPDKVDQKDMQRDRHPTY